MPLAQAGDEAPAESPRAVRRRWPRHEVGLNASGHLATIMAVSAGGVFGAIARYQVGLWAAQWGSGDFPAGTFLVNIIGSFALGLFMTLTTERFTGRRTSRLFVATGFLGSFTTFSTFSFEIAGLLQRGNLASAGLYTAASLGIGLVALVAGIHCARAL